MYALNVFDGYIYRAGHRGASGVPLREGDGAKAGVGRGRPGLIVALVRDAAERPLEVAERCARTVRLSAHVVAEN